MNVLEIGFGDGANVDFYPGKISLTGLDPKVQPEALKQTALSNLRNANIKFEGVRNAKGSSYNVIFFVLQVITYFVLR